MPFTMKTLSHQLPSQVWRLLFFITMIAVSLYGGLEYALRQPRVMKAAPITILGNDYPPFDEAYQRLTIYQKTVGEIDCIFLGSSLVLNGINPQIVAEQYAITNDTPLNCYTIGIGHLSAIAMQDIATLLIDEFSPKILFIGVSHRAFTQSTDAEYERQKVILDSAWGQYKLGDWSLSGWLQDTFYVARYYSGLNLNVLNIDLTPTDTTIWGHEPRYYYTIGSLRRFPIEPFRHFPLNDDERNTIQAFKSLPTEQTSIVILEMPIAPHQKEAIAGTPAAYNQVMSDLLNPLEQTEGLQVWRTDHLQFTDQDWSDAIHLYFTGTQQFSQWIGNHISLTSTNIAPPTTPLPPLTLDVDPVTGLSPTLQQQYEQYTPPNYPSHILNPLPPQVPHQEIMFALGINVNLEADIYGQTSDSVRRGFNLIHVLEQTRYEQDLTLTPEQQTALNNWRESYQLDDFAASGLTAILVTADWIDALSDNDRATLETDFVLFDTWFHAGEQMPYYLFATPDQ